MPTLLVPKDPNAFNKRSLHKILVAAKYSGLDLKVELTDELPADLQSNPLSKVQSFDWKWPVLVTEHGPVWDATAIARYVSRHGTNNLFGKSTFEEGLVHQWTEFVSTQLNFAVNASVYPILHLVELSDHQKQVAHAATKRLLGILDAYLLHNTFLVGNDVTLADITASLTVLDLYLHVLDEAMVKKYANVTRWFLTLITKHSFDCVGEHHFLADSYLQPLIGNEEAEGADGEESASEDESGKKKPRATGDRKGFRKVKKTQIVAAQQNNQPVAVSPTSRRKVTEEDLMGKAIPSGYFSPQPTKNYNQKHPAGNAPRNINQPK